MSGLPNNRTNSLSGEEIEQLLKRLKEVANSRLGLTNYIHLNNLNLADDGTFTVTMSRSSRQKPAGAPKDSEILDAYDIEEIGNLWEKELFWSWDKRYMTLRCSIDIRYSDGSTDDLHFTLDDEAVDMKEWQGSYISMTDSRSTVIENDDGKTVDTYFGEKVETRNEKTEKPMQDANKSDVKQTPSDGVSYYMTDIYKLWHQGENGNPPLKSYFENPKSNPSYDIKQEMETERVRYQAQRMSEILNDLSETRNGLPNSFESTAIKNRTSEYQELYASYNSLDNEIRPNQRYEEFANAWNRFVQTFRSLHSRMREI